MAGVHKIKGAVQNYAWGKVGSTSAVANLYFKRSEIEEETSYAELWMGAHPKAPSTLIEEGSSLADFIAKNPEVLGDEINKRYGTLPYLFKVLSVAKSLSIQAHPNKTLAEKLHSKRPDVYKDANHKPEMAIALTEFEALCGFRPVQEILKFFENVPELAEVVGKDSIEMLKKDLSLHEAMSSGLKACFSKVILCEKSIREKQLKILVSRVKEMVSNGINSDHVNGELLLRLHSHFPGDVGCFVVYFLNHIFLQPGEAMFLAANVPHAYLAGDCIECMACSDNVVRAGLTPKLVDAETLCSMLEYLPSCIENQLFKPESTGDQYEMKYNPPVDDFAVLSVKLPPQTKSYTFSKLPSASIILVVSGNGKSDVIGDGITKGDTFFLAANESFTISTSSEMLLYRATCIF